MQNTISRQSVQCSVRWQVKYHWRIILQCTLVLLPTIQSDARFSIGLGRSESSLEGICWEAGDLGTKFGGRFLTTLPQLPRTTILSMLTPGVLDLTFSMDWKFIVDQDTPEIVPSKSNKGHWEGKQLSRLPNDMRILPNAISDIHVHLNKIWILFRS